MIRVPLKDAIKKIEDKEVVKDWLDGLTEGSKANYLRALAEFTIITKKTPEELLEIAYLVKEHHTPRWENEMKNWFKNYREHSNNTGRSKATRNMRTTVIRDFFHFHELPTPKERRKRKKTDPLKIKNKRPALTKEKIKQALAAARNLRIKAIMLLQCSSGLSNADVVELKLKQFYDGLIPISDEGHEICMLHLEREKTGHEFLTFLSYEAVDALKNYINNEREFKDSPFLFTKHRITKEDATPQLTEDLVEDEYRKLNSWMGNELKEDGLYNDVTGHMCRKFMNTSFANSEMNYEPRKHMMGHVVPGVDNSYYLEHQDELIELYIKYMNRITINPTKTITLESPEYKELKERDEKREEERAREKAEYEEREQQRELERQKEREELKTMKARLERLEQIGKDEEDLKKI
jgi:site-specific recombinase XerD